ncbi:hypothetical protein BDV36DRAFT_269720 [Aspergillus pseudocaelatus]|uniref:Uncharacterized protein n=1 Tax=Aspergillus pseudocaelatus TaxID=1825620 RepID=A0ABQ6W7B5_9EURO|nr:hypothetical protein BDV36DRAFT_269720 [Aspergillus pseudocaelatus]
MYIFPFFICNYDSCGCILCLGLYIVGIQWICDLVSRHNFSANRLITPADLRS